jgi:hypothetical protein
MEIHDFYSFIVDVTSDHSLTLQGFIWGSGATGLFKLYTFDRALRR